MMANLRKYFFSGLLVWLPIWVTLLVISFLVNLMSNTLMLLPKSYQPDALLGVHIPLIGVFITLFIIMITGMMAANFLGNRIVVAWDGFVGRIPLVRTVYMGVKQVLETLLTPNGQSFRKVLWVEYPRKGLWTIAFQTGDASPDVFPELNGVPMVSLFVPTTPNPTSGFLLMVPKTDVVESEMSVDQALKVVISLGVMQPGPLKNGSQHIITPDSK